MDQSKKIDTPSLFWEVEVVSGHSFQTLHDGIFFHLLWVLNNQTEFCETSVRLGPKISKTVKGKLRLQAGSLQIEGVKSVFKKTFSIGKEERLLKASSPRVPVIEFWLLFHSKKLKIPELNLSMTVGNGADVAMMQ
ncbi:hypothetical protein AAG906_022018 [Vitis piasezkii]